MRPQLDELWHHLPIRDREDYLTPDGEVSVLMPLGSHVYAPLACDQLGLLTGLDIAILRQEGPGGIVTSNADLDNQLKTLLDALSIPSQPSAIAPNAAQSSDDDPAYVLLADDKLVSRLSVDTDRLLGAPAPDYVRVTIKVTLRPSRIIYANQLLIA